MYDEFFTRAGKPTVLLACAQGVVFDTMPTGDYDITGKNKALDPRAPKIGGH